MEFKGDPDYAYAVGVIRAKERDLLTRERFVRLVEAKDAHDLFRLLSDTPYGDVSRGESHPEGVIQKGLEREFLKSVSLFSILCRDEKTRETVFLRYDFHNVKVVFKERVTGKEFEAARYPDGNYPFDILKSAIEGNSWWDIHPSLRDALRKCRKKIEKNPYPHYIDSVIEKVMYEVILDKIEESRIPFVKQWIVSEIDLTNIGTLFRGRYAKRPWADIMDVLIEGGTLDASFYKRIWEDPVDSLPPKFQHTPYRNVVEKGVEGFQEGSFASLDRAMMEYRLVFHRESRYVAMGIEPLISYLFFKEMETKLIRTILVGKVNRVENKVLKELIPNALG